MPHVLERRYGLGHHHFVTFSCYRRQPYFADPNARDIFVDSLERTRKKYGFAVDAFVVMPEHVHLLVSEPVVKDLSVAMQALKISVARRLTQRPFWHSRFYGFNVFSDHKRVEKRRYIHRNPFMRGLVAHPKDWAWSSYLHWAQGVSCGVKIESTWTYRDRLQRELEERCGSSTSCEPTSQNRDVGHPPASKCGDSHIDTTDD